MKIRRGPDDLKSQGEERSGRVVIPQKAESIFQCHVYLLDVVDLTLSLISLLFD